MILVILVFYIHLNGFISPRVLGTCSVGQTMPNNNTDLILCGGGFGYCRRDNVIEPGNKDKPK